MPEEIPGVLVRVRRVWLVRLAAWLRSPSLLQWAERRLIVEVWSGGKWNRTEVTQ